MGDSSGGREAKGSSLKKSKSNPGSTAALKHKAKSIVSTRLPLVKEAEGVVQLDSAVALASRLFEHDRDRVLLRSKEEGVAVISWCNDIEKLSILADICKENTGLVYFLTGIHPDNIDRGNKTKTNEVWLERIEELSHRGECIGVLSGLNLQRDVGTHFAQESLLRSSMNLASRLQLPLVLHSSASSVERLLEMIKLERASGTMTSKILIHDAITATGACPDLIQKLNSSDDQVYLSVSAAGLSDAKDDNDEGIFAKAVACVRSIPLSRLLLCTDSPWKTPQNITDVYLRTLRNEPSNLSFVVRAVAEAIGLTLEEVQKTIFRNSKVFFGLEAADQIVEIKATSGPEAPRTQPKSTTVPMTQGTLVTDSSFFCRRCRAKLCDQKDVITHEVISNKVVLKVGHEEGLCAATIFVSQGEKDSAGLEIKHDVAECAECGAKVGRYFSFLSSGGTCPCGVVVPGPVFRLNSSKIDTHYTVDGAEQLAQLSLLSKSETEMLRLKDDFDEAAAEEGAGKKSKKKKKMASERGAGNFSSYRNKSFIPNASRVPRDTQVVSADPDKGDNAGGDSGGESS